MIELAPFGLLLVLGSAGARQLLKHANERDERARRWRELATAEGLHWAPKSGLPRLRGSRDGVVAEMGVWTLGSEGDQLAQRRRITRSSRKGTELKVLRQGRTPLGFVLDLERHLLGATSLPSEGLPPSEAEFEGAFAIHAGTPRACQLLARADLYAQLLRLPPRTALFLNGEAVWILWTDELTPRECFDHLPLAAALARLDFPDDAAVEDNSISDARIRSWTAVAEEWRAMAVGEGLEFACSEQQRTRRTLPTVRATIDGVSLAAGLRGPDDAVEISAARASDVHTILSAELPVASPLHITVRPIRDSRSPLVTRHDVEVGDAAFDRAFRVVSNDTQRCREVFGDASVREMLRSLEGAFELKLEEQNVTVRWRGEIKPAICWKAAPLVISLAQWRAGGRARAYR